MRSMSGKKLGTLIMVISTTLAIVLALLSQGWGLDLGPIQRVLVLRLNLFCLNESGYCAWDDSDNWLIGMPYKYLLIACIVIFVTGLLLRLEIIDSKREASRAE